MPSPPGRGATASSLPGAAQQHSHGDAHVQAIPRRSQQELASSSARTAKCCKAGGAAAFAHAAVAQGSDYTSDCTSGCTGCHLLLAIPEAMPLGSSSAGCSKAPQELVPQGRRPGSTDRHYQPYGTCPCSRLLLLPPLALLWLLVGPRPLLPLRRRRGEATQEGRTQAQRSQEELARQ